MTRAFLIKIKDTKGESKMNIEIKDIEGKVIRKIGSADLGYAHINGTYLRCIDWRGDDLSRASLHGDFRGANFACVILRGADLKGINLSSANLTSVDLTCADLRGADLSNATLSSATMIRADLTGANLKGANISHANLSGANLIDCNLMCSDLHYANLVDANLADANLRGADLHNADLSLATLTCSDLRTADLEGANVSYADLCSADLRGANLRKANLRGSVVFDTDMRHANFTGASLNGVDLSSSHINGASLIVAGVDQRGYAFYATGSKTELYIRAGCRVFESIEKAKDHWRGRHFDNQQLRDQCLELVDSLAKLIEEEKWGHLKVEGKVKPIERFDWDYLMPLS